MVIPPSYKVYLAGFLSALIPSISFVLPYPGGTELEQLVLGYGLAGLPFIYVMRHWRDLENTTRGLTHLLLFSAAFRCILLFIPPLLSEDAWRYLWDGSVQWAGINPYRYAPLAPELDALTNRPELAAIRAEIGHGEIPTVYPPAAQAFFMLITTLGPSMLGLRAGLICADLVVIWGIWRWAEVSGRVPQCAALYGFAPLAMMESAVGAHIDVLGAASMVLLALTLTQNRWFLSSLTLTVAIGVKLMPAIACIALIKRKKVLVTTLALCGFGFYCYALPTIESIKGLQAYAHRWRGNDGAFALFVHFFQWVWPVENGPVQLSESATSLVRLLVGVGPGGEWRKVWPDELVFASAKLMAGVIWASVFGWCVWTRRSVMMLLGVCIPALMLLSPVVHPWYLLWVLPFAAWNSGGTDGYWALPFFVWSLLSWLAYIPRPHYIATGDWIVPAWVPWVEYVPVWVLLIGCSVVLIRQRKRSKASGHLKAAR